MKSTTHNRHIRFALCTALLLTGCGVQPPPPTLAPAAQTPTAAPRAVGWSAASTAFTLPGRVLSFALAAHPGGDGIAATASARFTLTAAPIAAYVRVRQPGLSSWDDALQLDVPPRGLSERTGSALIASLGGDALLAAWGGSASDDGGVWAQESADFGRTWGQPRKLLDHARTLLALHGTPDGRAVLVAEGFTRSGGSAPGHTSIVVRAPDGRWEPPQTLPVAAVFAAALITSAPGETRAVLWLGDKRHDAITLASRPLDRDRHWVLQTVSAPNPDPDAFPWHPRGTIIESKDGPGVVFSWTRRGQSAVFALRSLDAGRTWRAVETVRPHLAGETVTWAAPLYDAATERVLVLFPCCGDLSDGAGATHQGASSPLTSTRWAVSAAPLLLGERAAEQTLIVGDGAQAWIGWVEQGGRVELRRRAVAALLPEVTP